MKYRNICRFYNLIFVFNRGTLYKYRNLKEVQFTGVIFSFFNKGKFVLNQRQLYAVISCIRILKTVPVWLILLLTVKKPVTVKRICSPCFIGCRLSFLDIVKFNQDCIFTITFPSKLSPEMRRSPPF